MCPTGWGATATSGTSASIASTHTCAICKRRTEMVTATEFKVEREAREIVMARVFDAPRETVLRALTDPEMITNWWGPRGYTTRIDKMDLRPGGEWRFVQHDLDGNEHAFHGEHREVVPPERLVITFEYEGMPGHVSLQTLTLEEVDGKTRVVSTASFENDADLEGMVQSGLEKGAVESWERLAELIEQA